MGYQALYRPPGFYQRALAEAGLEPLEQCQSSDFVADELSRRLVGPRLWPWLGRGVAAPVRLAARAYRRRRSVDVLACLARPRTGARVTAAGS